jgi:hypothetical protein
MKAGYYLAGILITSVFALLAVAASGRGSAPEPSHATPAESVVDVNGDIHVPDGYRTSYEFLGTWAVAATQGQGARELHTVYVSRGMTSAYRNTGRFPEGTVLVKEVFVADTAPMTTGTVSHAQILKGWFVMIRDTTGRYSGNKLWGDGWGWSWFDADNPSRTTSTDYKGDCLGCHIPAKSSEWIYVRGYPSLRR